jgi:hypothetical protein
LFIFGESKKITASHHSASVHGNRGTRTKEKEPKSVIHAPINAVTILSHSMEEG